MAEFCHKKKWQNTTIFCVFWERSALRQA